MTPRADSGTPELVERLYSSIGDLPALRESMASVSRLVGAEAAAVQEYDFRQRKGRGMALLNIGEPFLRRYLEHYSALNVWMVHGRHKVGPGRILLSHEMYPDARLEHTEWYTDFLRPEKLFHSSGVVLGLDDGVSTSVTFLREKAGGRFDAREAGVLRRFAPHLRRVFRLHRQFMAASIRTDDAKHVLDCLPVGVVVIDGRMRVDSANQKGREIFAQGDGLKVQADCLVAPPAQDRALRALVVAALATPPACPSVLKIARSGDQCPLEISVSPIPAAPTLWGVGTPRVAVFIAGQQQKDPLSIETLQALYHLTPAEARLAAALAGGEELRTVAERLGVTVNTVKSQLSSIFAKTDTRRQSELVHRLLTSPARFRRPGS